MNENLSSMCKMIVLTLKEFVIMVELFSKEILPIRRYIAVHSPTMIRESIEEKNTSNYGERSFNPTVSRC